MEDSETKYNPMQSLKRAMFAMRNGVVADALRQGGCPFKIIFGVNLPQLAEIAAGSEHTKEFAEQVWANSTTRESMLIAPMLMPVDGLPRPWHASGSRRCRRRRWPMCFALNC